MRDHVSGLSPGGPDDYYTRLWNVIEFWNHVKLHREDAGGTSWGVLEDLDEKVGKCLASRPVRLRQAEAITAKAALLISGHWLS